MAQDGYPENSPAIRKIYLEYATVQDANSAEGELAGRSFGNNVVQVRAALVDNNYTVLSVWLTNNEFFLCFLFSAITLGNLF